MFHVKLHLLTWGTIPLLLCSQGHASQNDGSRSRSQFHMGLEMGAASFDKQTPFPTPLGFLLAGRADVILGRSSPQSWGYGPMLGIGWVPRKNFFTEVGASVLFPLSETFPFVFSAGPYWSQTPSGEREPGAFAHIFWGSRSYNYSGNYGMAFGLAVEAHKGFGSDHEKALMLSAHLDLELLSLPFELLINAFR